MAADYGSKLVVADDSTVSVEFGNDVTPAKGLQLISLTTQSAGNFMLTGDATNKWKVRKENNGLYLVRRPFTIIVK